MDLPPTRSMGTKSLAVFLRDQTDDRPRRKLLLIRGIALYSCSC